MKIRIVDEYINPLLSEQGERQYKKVVKGMQVFWIDPDPDNDLAISHFKIEKIINEECILIKNKTSEAEVYPHELVYIQKG